MRGGRGRGMGLRVLVEQKMGRWHPPVTKLQMAASPPQNPNLLLPVGLCRSETGCDPQGLGFNSSPAVPPSRAMPRGSAERLLVRNRDTEMRKCLLWHQLAPVSCRAGQLQHRVTQGWPECGLSYGTAHSPICGHVCVPT